MSIVVGTGHDALVSVTGRPRDVSGENARAMCFRVLGAPRAADWSSRPVATTSHRDLSHGHGHGCENAAWGGPTQADPTRRPSRARDRTIRSGVPRAPP